MKLVEGSSHEWRCAETLEDIPCLLDAQGDPVLDHESKELIPQPDLILHGGAFYRAPLIEFEDFAVAEFPEIPVDRIFRSGR